MKDLQEQLVKLGFTENEARVYLALIKFGELNGSQVSKRSKLDRSFCYTVLNNLIGKGYVKYVMKDSKKTFSATNPKKIIDSIKERENMAKSLVPKLKEVSREKLKNEKVSVYEGSEGLKVLFEKFFSLDKDCYCFGGSGKSYDVLYYEIPHLVKRYEKSGLKIKGIISHFAKGHEMVNLKNSDIRFIPDLDASATTTIVGDVVAIHTLGSVPRVIIIEDAKVASSYKKHFEFMWKNASKII